MSPSSKKVKTIRLHTDTHSRLEKWKAREACKSADEMVSKMLDAYEVYKGKTTKEEIQKSPHLIVKELKSLQDALVDAINSLRKTYSSENEWRMCFPFRNFGEALGFDWNNVDVSEVNVEKEENSTVINLRRRWVQEIQNIVEQIKELTKQETELIPEPIEDEEQNLFL